MTTDTRKNHSQGLIRSRLTETGFRNFTRHHWIPREEAERRARLYLAGKERRKAEIREREAERQQEFMRKVEQEKPWKARDYEGEGDDRLMGTMRWLCVGCGTPVSLPHDDDWGPPCCTNCRGLMALQEVA